MLSKLETSVQIVEQVVRFEVRIESNLDPFLLGDRHRSRCSVIRVEYTTKIVPHAS